MRIEIVPYKATWPDAFQSFARQVKDLLQEDALAIHHIGSTSVKGLDAKDVIDIQITVKDLTNDLSKKLESLKVLARPDIYKDHCPPGMTLEAKELAKCYFQTVDVRRNIHVRELGRFNQRYALLCRDYLRSHKTAADAYGEMKRQLARYFPKNEDAYYDIKDPTFDIIMSAANDWASYTKWQLPESDV